MCLNPQCGFGHIYWSSVKNFAEGISFSKRSNANFVIITKQNALIETFSQGTVYF